MILHRTKYTPYYNINDEQLYLKQGIVSLIHPKQKLKHDLIIKGLMLKLDNNIVRQNVINNEVVDTLLVELDEQTFINSELNQFINTVKKKFNVNQYSNSYYQTFNNHFFFRLNSLSLSNYLVYTKSSSNKWSSFMTNNLDYLKNMDNQTILPYFQVYVRYENDSFVIDLKLVKVYVGQPNELINL